MNAKEAIVISLNSSQAMVPMFLTDLSDEDILVRPVPSANIIAWQLGHLISSESHLVKSVAPKTEYPELPAGFAQRHSPESAKSDDVKGYLKKDEYLALLDKTRKVTLEALGTFTEADLDNPTSGPMAAYAPNVAAMFLLLSNHTLMHAGQFSVVRRKLGKPVLF